MFADITINGGLAHMRVDTGSATNLLSTEAADRLHMTQHMLAGAQVSGVGGSRPVDMAVSDSVMLGAARGSNIAFITVAPDAFPPGTDGLLGMDFLVRYDDDLDFTALRLRLVRAQGDCTNPNSPLPPPLYGIRMDALTPGGSPVVDVLVNGMKLRALVDTGAVQSLLFRSAAERVGLPVPALLASRGASIRGVGGEATRAAPVPGGVTLSVGDLQVRHLQVTVADQQPGAEVDMLLGYDFARKVHLWLSHSSHTLLMQYPPVPTPLAP
jgi:predicted aspartyl protease